MIALYKMKDMKYGLGILLNALVMVSMTAQVNNRMIVKSLDMSLINKVHISTEGDIEYKQWNKTYGRVLVSVSTEGLNSSELKNLVLANRYQMKQVEMDGNLHLSFPNLDQELLEGIKEHIQIKCFLPEHVSASSSVETDRKTEELLF